MNTLRRQRNYVDDNVYAKSTARYGYAFFARATEAKRMETLLQAGASARGSLKEAAAQTWDVPRAEIEAKDSVLTHTRTRRTLTYGQVATRAASVRLDMEPARKPHYDWWFLGKANPPRVQPPLLVNGGAVLGVGCRRPTLGKLTSNRQLPDT